MTFSKEKMLKILTLIVIVAFVIVSFFSCFEIISVPIVVRDELFDAPSRYEDYDNNIVLSITFAIVQFILLFIDKKWTRIACVAVATITAIATIGGVVKCILICVNQPMAGLSSLNFRITIFGYLALFFSFLNIFVQVYSLVKWKKRSESNDTYNNPIGN